MILFSTSQLTPSYGAGSATWSLSGGATAETLETVSIADDDPNLERSDVYSGNETGGEAMITSSSDAGLVGKTIFLGDLDSVNEDYDDSTHDELVYPTTPSGIEAYIVKIAVYSGSGSTTDPANYTQYYAFWGSEAEEAQTYLLTHGSIGTTSGNIEEELDYSGFVVCFCNGTLIKTATGDVPVEDIRPGDLLATLDHGLQPVLSCSLRRVSAAEMAADPTTRPIIFKPGSLGQNIPARELRVSRHHRMLIQSPLLKTLCENSEVLVPAVKLLPQAGVTLGTATVGVTYYHLWLRQHEVLSADGTPAESLFVPQGASNPLAHFPSGPCHDAPARPILEDKSKVRRLINMSRRQGKDLVTAAGFDVLPVAAVRGSALAQGGAIPA